LEDTVANDDLAFRPAVELVTLLQKREASSRELLDLYLSRVERINPTVNAIVTLDADNARKRAAAADDATARGESWGPLHGLPITVKDVFETAGLRTTAGDPELSDHVPERDAVLVARLRKAGAVIFGKTNTPTQAADGQTFNSLFGTTNNPWNLEVTPGGSSGGCGAALASGMTALSFGSDIAGSIRIPASFCGLYGHKPTWGLIPQRGHIPGPPGQLIERDINTVGPLARDHRDLDLALSVLAGPMTQEALGWRMEPAPPTGKPLREYRVAAWLDDDYCPVDSHLTERFNAAVDALRDAGAAVDTEARPPVTFKDAFELYVKLLRIPLVDDRAMSHIEWLDLDDIRQRYRDEWAEFFERYDVLLCPVCSTAPFPHDQGPREQRHYRINGEDRPYYEYIAWPGLIGLALLPSTSTPLGPASNGLPVGVQVVGPHLSDRRTIEFAGKLTEIIGGFQRPPGY
jgi:amidase